MTTSLHPNQRIFFTFAKARTKKIITVNPVRVGLFSSETKKDENKLRTDWMPSLIVT
jgi:hypothetical protein